MKRRIMMRANSAGRNAEAATCQAQSVRQMTLFDLEQKYFALCA
jgi:hypothetical protein